MTNIEIQRFAMLFRGKNDTYVKNKLPLEEPEKGIKIRTNITSVRGQVNNDLIEHHLNGDFGIGICPVNAEGKCYFGVIDIDYYKDRKKKALDLIRDFNLPLVAFRSKSGGLHLYLFTQSPVSANSMRDILNKIRKLLALDNLFGATKVEIFPKQDNAQDFGSAITLPYFKGDDTYTPMVDLYGNRVDFSTAMMYIQSHITTLEKIREILGKLPYFDAPPCIQKILLSRAVGEEDTGRNNFLFSFAIYAKKKHGDGFDTFVKEINETFTCPLGEDAINQLCESVRSNEYIYKCKDIPCNGYCDKSECRKREFGLGRDKGHFTGIDYGQLYRYKANEPYYIWKLRLQGQEQWKDVMFKSEGDLLEQKNFARMCVRYLNQAPMQVSANDWYSILNSVLPTIQEVEVTKETDTTGGAILREAFVSYLSDKVASIDRPYQIHAGLCYRKQEGEVVKYYFTTQGFTNYLAVKRVPFDHSTLRQSLLGFGAKEDTFTYTNIQDEVRTLKCWSKTEDDEVSQAYTNVQEVEKSDQAMYDTFLSVTDDKEEEKPKSYTKEEYDDAKTLL